MSTGKTCTRKAWAGFVDGKMDLETEPRVHDGYATLYKTKREALKRYQDVRPVVIREDKDEHR